MKFDHINVSARDIVAMRDFLVSILGVTDGLRPDFGDNGFWLYDGDKPVIHISEREDDRSDEGWLDHVAFSGFDFTERCQTFERLDLEYFVGGVPGTGIRQVFVKGPEGAKIEFQCAE